MKLSTKIDIGTINPEVLSRALQLYQTIEASLKEARAADALRAYPSGDGHGIHVERMELQQDLEGQTTLIEFRFVTTIWSFSAQCSVDSMQKFDSDVKHIHRVLKLFGVEI